MSQSTTDLTCLDAVEVVFRDPELYPNELQYGTSGAAAIDLCSSVDIVLKPGDCVFVDSGVSIWHGVHPYGRHWAGILIPRSGLGSKGLIIGNSMGLIDSDYQGKLMMKLWNRNRWTFKGWWARLRGKEDPTTFVIKRGDRVAQYFYTPVAHPGFKRVEQFSNPTVRGENGFGHTGV